MYIFTQKKPVTQNSVAGFQKKNEKTKLYFLTIFL